MLADAVAMVVPQIGAVLVPPIAGRGLIRAAKALPDGAVAVYVECRCGAGADRCDLLACYLSTSSLRPSDSIVDGDRPEPGWRLAEKIQTQRRSRASALCGRSPLVWLEFDDVGRASSMPSPSVCVCIEPTYLARDRYREPARSCVEMAAESANVAGLDASDRSALEHAIRSLPPVGRAIHVSFMVARTPPVTKLYVRVPAARAAAYLDEIGWSGDRATVGQLLASQGTRDEWIHLDISIADGAVLRRLGLAFPNADREKRFDIDIFERLAANALDRDDAAGAVEAALAWTQDEPALRAPGGWPSIVHRWIDQKIVVSDDALELKLYLAVRPLPALFGAMATAGGR